MIAARWRMTAVIHDAAPGSSGIGRGLWVGQDENLIHYSNGRAVNLVSGMETTNHT
jgi:hypothetical protein